MEIDRVELSDFRNYRRLSLTPSPQLNILAGLNAQGKTNLLEGLGVLLVGRSFRGAKAVEMLAWGAPTAYVTGDIRRGETVRAIRRSIAQREDGRWGVGGEGCAWTRAIGFGWPDLAILTEGPQARRNFVDGFAGKLYAAHLSGLSRYRQIVARRNHLLQSGLSERALRNALAPWNEQLARVGLELVGRRRQAVSAIESEARDLYPALAGAGAVRLRYAETGHPIRSEKLHPAPPGVDRSARPRFASPIRNRTSVWPVTPPVPGVIRFFPARSAAAPSTCAHRVRIATGKIPP